MLAPVSVGLKFGFLIILYLFLMWVAWSALRDLRRGRGGVVRSDPAAPYDATGMYDAARDFARAPGAGHGVEPPPPGARAPRHETRGARANSRPGATLRRA